MEQENDEDEFIKENPIIFKKYRVKKKLGEGAFGDVYLGQSIHDNDYVAIKTEIRKIIKPILEAEAFLLYSIAGPGIPEVKSFGKTKKYNILVEPLLGRSLFDFFTENHKSMNIVDACLIGMQIIDRIQWVHSKYIVHRDIKPDNFLIGRKDPNILYLIDFGLAKKYRSSATGKHIKFGFTGKLTGTVRFASANALRGGEQSRRDDIESIGYMMVYFLKKKLPWQNITGTKKMERYIKIYKMKKFITPEKLCEGIFPEMAEFIAHAKNLEFEQEPDYNFLKNVFKRMLTRVNKTNDQLIFSWIKMSDINRLKKPINPTTRKDSPQNRLYKAIKNKLESGKNISSDSDTKVGNYSKTYIQENSTTNVIIDSKVNSSGDQFEMKDKKTLDKSVKSKDALNTTIDNLEVSFDENIVDFEEINNQKEDLDLGNNENLNKINKILEFNKNITSEKNNKNENLNSNIKDNPNNNIDTIINKNNEEKYIENKQLNKKINKDDEEKRRLIDNSKKNININELNIKKDISNFKVDKAELNFNGSFNNNIDINQGPKDSFKPKKNIIKIKNEIEMNKKKEETHKLLTIKTEQSTEKRNNSKKENGNNPNNKQFELSMKKNNKSNIKEKDNNKVNKILKNNINEKKLIKIKNNKRIEREPSQKINKNKKENILKNINNNKNIGDFYNRTLGEITDDNKNSDIIGQISKEKNNNLYNICDDEIDFNLDLNYLKKRPSAYPTQNHISINKIDFSNKNNNNIKKNSQNFSLLNYTSGGKDILKNKAQTKVKITKVKNNCTLSQNHTNFLKENNNDYSNLIKKTEYSQKYAQLKKLNKTVTYGGINKNSSGIPNKRTVKREKNLIPEDNIYDQIDISNINRKFYSNTKNKNNSNYINVNDNNQKIFGDMKIIKNNLNENKYGHNIIINNKNRQNINKINKMITTVNLNNSANKTKNRIINNNSINKIVNTSQRNKTNSYNTPNNTIQKIDNDNYIPLNKHLQLINNTISDFPYKSNLSGKMNNFIDTRAMVSPAINYQFPVYINNNNNIYNTQYLNPVGNLPIRPEINQINSKIITIAPTQIQTNINFGQNLDVQYLNNQHYIYNGFNNLSNNLLKDKKLYTYTRQPMIN